MVQVQGEEGNLQALTAIQMALIWSWGRGELEGSHCRGCPEGLRNSPMVSMKWRHPNGGRLVSRIEAGFTKGQARPLFVVKRR